MPIAAALNPFRLAVAAALLAALALRVWAASVPAMAHPDELFQYLEQAHRLVFGYGIVPWEYRLGMRSWLVPLALSGPMRLGAWLAPEGQLYLLLPKLAVAAFSLLIPAAAYALGARISRMHGFIALIVAGIWYELVYFGAHMLTEAAAVAMILPAAALLMREEERQTARRIALAGFLLGLGAILRFHYLPAMAVLALLTCKGELRARWLPLVLGGAAALALGALLDLAMGQPPFGWLLENFRQNIVANRAADFGVSSPLEYLRLYLDAWGFWLVPILLFIVPVFGRYRPLFWMAVANLVVHSAIGHKEYRFVLLTTAILIVLAAIGSAEWARRLAPRLPPRSARFLPAALVLLWVGVSASFAAGDRMRPRWTAFSPGFEAAASLGRVPGLCGAALYDLSYWESGGYTHLHRPVPLYVARSPADAGPSPDIRALGPAFNAILAPADRQSALPPGYRTHSCASMAGQGRGSGNMFGTHRVCAFVRSGGCDPRAAGEQRLDNFMRRLEL